jgi:hypothetical protein
MGLDHMGEDGDEEEEEEDVDDGGDTTAPPAAAPPPPVPPATLLKEIDEEVPVEAIPEQQAPKLHEVVPEVPQLRLYHALMRDYEENSLRLKDDFDDLDDNPSEDYPDMDE